MADAMSIAGVAHGDQPMWSGKQVAIKDVVDAVEDLRRQEQKAASRASVATLIIVTRTPDELDAAETVIEHLGVRHPARIITLLASGDAGKGPDRVDADVILHTGEAAGHSIWSDELRLRVSGGPARHLASLLRPLQLSDLPVVAWYVSGLPDARDPLLKLTDAVVVDTKTVADQGEGEPAMRRAFDAVVDLTRKHRMIDLSWQRLRPWRQLLAGQFDGAVFRPFVKGVERIDVTGKLGPRTLLAGWLSSRLEVDRDLMHLYDGRHVSIKMACRQSGATADFRVERIPGERLVRASAEVSDGPSHNEVLTLPSDTLPLSLAESLRSLEHDRIYEQAVKFAGTWL